MFFATFCFNFSVHRGPTVVAPLPERCGTEVGPEVLPQGQADGGKVRHARALTHPRERLTQVTPIPAKIRQNATLLHSSKINA